MNISDIIILILIIFALIGAFIYAMKEVNRAKEERLQEEKQKKAIPKYRSDNNIPENADLCCCTNITVEEELVDRKWNVFIWKDNDVLYLCGEYDGIRKIGVPVENVQFYTRKGDYRIESVTEGGGVNIGNAIIGGIVGAIIGAILMGTIGMIVAFGIGALLAGREKTITKNKEIDNRKTYLNYFENNENKRMVFTSYGYEILSKLIPEKEISYFENNKIVESDKSINTSNNIYRDIEKLAELKEKGILTEEEFNEKKQLLLDKIQ